MHDSLRAVLFLRNCSSSNSPSAQQTKDFALITGLQELRAAINQFHKDTSAYPNGVTDLVDSQAQPPVTGLDGNGGTGIVIPNGNYKGPYFLPQGGIDNSGIPLIPTPPLRAVRC